MACDVLIFNTAVVDFRSNEFKFAEQLAGPGGLAKCDIDDMPAFEQRDYQNWIKAGRGTAGGPGNTAPLLARAGLGTAVGVNLGAGEFDGLDAQGRFFHDVMTRNKVDMSQTYIHPALPTGTTFIYEADELERGGIAYFPNANNEFDFDRARASVEALKPTIVYYMYSGLSDQGDARNGKDLADFLQWCRDRGMLTLMDSHTLVGDLRFVIESCWSIPHYELLKPLLPVVDVFFTSSDEARLIDNTLGVKGRYRGLSTSEFIGQYLNFIETTFWTKSKQPKLFGVTVKDGAWVVYRNACGKRIGPQKVESRFMQNEVVDLVGAGDSFRAGLIAYLSRYADTFRSGQIDIEEAIQTANLFASLYVTAPLDRRYSQIGKLDRMLEVVRSPNSEKAYQALVKSASSRAARRK